MTEQLAIRNGLVFDSIDGTFRPGDVVVTDGRVTAVGPDTPAGPGAVTIDAAGAIVAPGLVDMHTHIFRGQDLGIDAAAIGPPTGTTTFVDTGSAGAHLWGAFHAAIADLPQRVLAFINIATVGTTSILLQGELATGRYVDTAACVAAARDRPAVGVKVRASCDVASTHADAALGSARDAADELALPLMVHLGPAPSAVETILSQLRAGDILTHCFTSFAENGLLADGRLRSSVIEARNRGVLFDVGHGQSGFDSATALRAFELGFLPDTISTDLHAYSIDHVIDFPAVLGRFLALGVPLADVLTRATSAPARALGVLDQGIGHLTPGGVGDIVVLRAVDDVTEFVDANGRPFTGAQRLVVEATVQAGRVVHRANDAR